MRRLGDRLHRGLRRASSWRPRTSGARPLPVPAIVSPLRYDVVVRARFFDLVEEHEGRPLEDLVEAGRGSDYRRWFTDVAMARHRPWVLDRPEQLDTAFAQRVSASRELWRSFDADGFDRAARIVLRSITPGTPDELGAPLDRPLHLGDGGHRLALVLRSTGVLEPWMYVVAPSSMPVLDNTARMFGPQDADQPAYLDFLASGYATPGTSGTTGSAASPSALVERVERERGAAAATELRGVILSHRVAWRSGTSHPRLA